MANIVRELERRDRCNEGRRRKRFLGGLACLVAVWIGLRLTPPETRNAVLGGWGNFPSGIFEAWHARPLSADGTTLTVGGFESEPGSKKKRRRPRSKRKRKTKRPTLKAPRHMRDALRNDPGVPRSWERVSKKSKRKKTATHKKRSARKKKTRAVFGTAIRKPSVRKPVRTKTRRTTRRHKPSKTRKRSAKKVSRARPASPKKTPRPDFDGRIGRSKGGTKLAYRLPNSSIGRLPDFYKPKRVKSARPKKQKKEIIPKAPTVSKLLGTGSLAPPSDSTAKKAPSFSKLKDAFPPTLPDGKSYDKKTPPPFHVETVSPPNEHDLYERWLEIDSNKNRKKGDAHWHGDGNDILFMHYGKVWGSPKKRRWSWTVKQGTKWWTLADGAQRMVRHKTLWWWKTEFGWFPLVEGKPRGAAFAPDWKRKGLLKKGWTVKFSEDLSRVAVTTPGLGTTVFDARTGQYISLVPEKAKIAK